MENNYELGYTPANLKMIQKKHGISNNKMAEMMNCTIQTVSYWRTDAGKKHHFGMRYAVWIEFLGMLE